MLIKGMGNISNASSIMVKQCDSSIHPWLRPARTAARIARPRPVRRRSRQSHQS